jgi:drug/metabolite transporter (DMT)-like permease
MNALSPATLGMVYCLLAPIAYTAYNLCLRGVSKYEDSAWITCVQASVGVAVFGVYLIWQSLHGRRALPPWKETLSLLVIGLITQIGGVAMVWAMGVVGVGATATIQMGLMLALAAILGWILLGESVSWPQWTAIALIVAAVLLFTQGAQANSDAAKESVASSQTALRTLLGIGGGVLAGVAFAILVVGVRKAVTSATSAEAVVFLISLMGVAFMGPLCVVRLGMKTLLATPLPHLGIMLAAGMMNVIGFLLFTKALQLASVVRVNVANNALTMALTVLAGILFFKEAWNAYLGFGITLSFVGIVLISLGGRPTESPLPPEEG